jgi:hypothetical protein
LSARQTFFSGKPTFFSEKHANFSAGKTFPKPEATEYQPLEDSRAEPSPHRGWNILFQSVRGDILSPFLSGQGHAPGQGTWLPQHPIRPFARNTTQTPPIHGLINDCGWTIRLFHNASFSQSLSPSFHNLLPHLTRRSKSPPITPMLVKSGLTPETTPNDRRLVMRPKTGPLKPVKNPNIQCTAAAILTACPPVTSLPSENSIHPHQRRMPLKINIPIPSQLPTCLR